MKTGMKTWYENTYENSYENKPLQAGPVIVSPRRESGEGHPHFQCAGQHYDALEMPRGPFTSPMPRPEEPR